VSDWLDAGHTPEELKELVAAAPLWEPQEPESAQPEREPASRPALPLQSLGELLAEPEEAVEWAVEGLLPSGGVSLCVAKPKVGKSTLARTLALAVSRGEPFLGRETQQGPVIYLALEEKRGQLINQFRALGATGAEPISIFAGIAPKMAVELLRQAIIEHDPVLVIVDTIQRLIRVRDGNDYSGVTSAMEPILAMARELGPHLHLLHHAGKGERDVIDAAIGSTAWTASVDTAMQMKRSENARTLATIQRYGEDLPETILVMDAAGRIEAGGTRNDHDRAQAEKAILDYVGEAPGATKDDIREEVKLKTQVVQEALTRLVKEKKLRRDGGGKKGDPYRHFVAEGRPEDSSEDSGSQERENRNKSSIVNGSEPVEKPVPTHTVDRGNRSIDDSMPTDLFEDGSSRSTPWTGTL
jgi:KaiC/GvpD/RAD55 family RecA-like ATPase